MQSLKGKVISAFLLGCAAIGLAVFITQFTFSELLNTVDTISAPNEKLKKLNSFYHRVTQLDQKQRAEAIKNPDKPFESYISETDTLLNILHELKRMDWKDNSQYSRFDSMEVILENRTRLFINFLRLRSSQLNNAEFSSKIDTLSALLYKKNDDPDSNLVTTAKKVVTTTLEPDTVIEESDDDDRSFFGRLFGKKKKDEVADKPRSTLKRETVISYDTIAMAHRDSTFVEVERMMKTFEKDKKLEDIRLQREELKLITSSSLLLTQLLNLLHQVESEEYTQLKSNNNSAISLVETSVKRINYILFFFLLIAALLVFLILIDISNANFYKDQLIKEKERAVELSNIKQRFLANMSHEIRTPLQSIIGFAEQLRSKSQKNPMEINAIYNSSEHLLQIVNEVLDYSRITSGKFTFAKKTFSLKDLLTEVSEAMRIQAAKKSLDFIYNPESFTNYTAVSDPFRLRQILYNLIGNAIKFTEKGEISLDVELENKGAEIKTCFKIRDTGIGMAPEELERVFQNFEQANEQINQKYGGTGLGLSIVKNLVDAQGGKLKVKSSPGKGTEFSVLLNLIKSENSSLKKISEKPDNHLPFKGRVLLVDDDKTILMLCANILKKHNIEYEVNSNSREVYNRSIDSDFVFALLDIRMPEVSGIDLCKKLKLTSSGLKVIALTAHVLEDKSDEISKAGFDGILKKPFKESELLEILGISSIQYESISKRDINGYIHLKPESIDKITMGDRELERLILNQFLKDCKQDLNDLKSYYEGKEHSKLREPVHRLSGRTAQFGAEKLAYLFHSIENALESKNTGEKVLKKIDEAMVSTEIMITETAEYLVREY